MSSSSPEYIPWSGMDDPLPDNPLDVVRVIVLNAAARRRAACSHKRTCPCTACQVRRYDEARPSVARRTA